jgi:signal transduction histidine kinase
VLAAFGCVLGVYAVLLAIWVPDSLTLPAPVHVCIGLSFVGAGTAAWLRRPDNRTGMLMTITGLVWFGRDFDWLDTAFTTHVDALATNLFIALVAHQLVVFPDGRASTRLQRTLVYSVYGLATLGYAVTTLGQAANLAVDVAAAAVAVAILVQLARRWSRASPPARRALAPVVWAGPPVLAVVLAMVALDSGGPWPGPVEDALHWVALAFVALPLAFLAGLLRTQLHRVAITNLIVQVSQPQTPESLRDALARALGDPSLEIAYWLPEHDRYVDRMGHPIETPARSSDNRAVTVIDHDEQRLAALLHDPQLLEEPDLVEAVAAAARLALQNARLQAELLARLDEVRSSRARIVAAGDAERRRIERDLHDGAQQRMLGIRLTLRLLHDQPAIGSGSHEQLLREVEDELVGAIEDLRDLARGIHPAVLTDEGLSAALETLSRRAPVAVTLAAVPDHRLPADVEAAAYFVAAEALTNATKHATASAITVSVAPRDGRLVIDISDDGVGGASASAGGGLAGLSDRITALDGTMRLDSEPGTGTTLHVEIPLGQ